MHKIQGYFKNYLYKFFLKERDQLNSKSFQVEGMNCNNCVDLIRSSVSSIEGVKNVKIDFDSKEVTVDFDNTTTSEQDIKNKIIDAGYGIK